MQLGILLEIRPGDPIGRTADRIAGLGFTSLHAHFPAGCDRTLARSVAGACADNGLALVAVSGYANLLRPDDAPMGSTLAQLLDLIELLPRLGARRIVSWSGTFAPGIFDTHPDTRGSAGWDALRSSVDEIFPLLDETEAILVLRPHHAHVLADPDEIAAFCAEFNSPYLRVALDPAGLLAPDAWERQEEYLPAGVAALAPYIGLVHLGDLAPRQGQGRLDLGLLMRTLRAAEIVAPMIVQPGSLDEAAAVRRRILTHTQI